MFLLDTKVAEKGEKKVRKRRENSILCIPTCAYIRVANNIATCGLVKCRFSLKAHVIFGDASHKIITWTHASEQMIFKR